MTAFFTFAAAWLAASNQQLENHLGWIVIIGISWMLFLINRLAIRLGKDLKITRTFLTFVATFTSLIAVAFVAMHGQSEKLIGWIFLVAMMLFIILIDEKILKKVLYLKFTDEQMDEQTKQYFDEWTKKVKETKI